MGVIETAVWLIDVGARETMLFAAFGFLIGGADDVLVDLIYLARRVLRRQRDVPLAALPRPHRPGRLAIFVAAWDESAVIGAMLRAALARLRNVEYVIYVGCYPNDPGTIEAVAAVARDDSRIRLVVGTGPGPTTKAGCLNTLWTALIDDDAAHGRATRAVVLHDAEDVVHPDELTVYDCEWTLIWKERERRDRLGFDGTYRDRCREKLRFLADRQALSRLMSSLARHFPERSLQAA